jgi:hypothetical protein
MEPNAADTNPTHRATRPLAAVIERSVTAAPITAAVPVGCLAGSNSPAAQVRKVPQADQATTFDAVWRFSRHHVIHTSAL